LWFLGQSFKAVLIYNQTPHKANGGKSPYFALTHEQPKLDKYLYPFGAKVYTKIQTKQNKLLPKLRPGKYLGLLTTSSYRICVPDTNSVTCTWDIAFVDETSTIKVHEEPILDFSNLPSSQPTVLQQPPTPVPPDNAGLADSLLDTTLDGVDRKFLIESNFNQSDADPCVYTRLNKTVKTLMTVYVDDLTLIGTPHDISEIKKLLASRFPIRDLGPAKSILGVEVIWDFKGGTTTLRQRGHIAALLKFASIEDCLPAYTPM